MKLIPNPNSTEDDHTIACFINDLTKLIQETPDEQKRPQLKLETKL